MPVFDGRCSLITGLQRRAGALVGFMESGIAATEMAFPTPSSGRKSWRAPGVPRGPGGEGRSRERTGLGGHDTLFHLAENDALPSPLDSRDASRSGQESPSGCLGIQRPAAPPGVRSPSRLHSAHLDLGKVPRLPSLPLRTSPACLL